MNNIKNLVPTTIIALGLVAMGIFIYLGYQSQPSGGEVAVEGAVSKDQAKKIALDFINNTMLQGQASASITDVTEERGVYKLDLLVSENPFSSYITKDGKLFFIEGILIEEFDPNSWMMPQGEVVDPTQEILP